MKTAMQYAFEHQKLWIESGFKLDKWFENYEQIHLKREKEQKMDFANWCRIHENLNKNKVFTIQQLFDKYYNQTFKSE
jgi:hypothetical protein